MKYLSLIFELIVGIIKGYGGLAIYLLYGQYKSILILINNPSKENLQEAVASLCFWIPADIIFIGVPVCLTYYLYKLCKKRFNSAVK